MFRLRRRVSRKHAELFREELGESLSHLAQAANHAAGGLGATVGPRYEAARVRVTPAAERVRAAAAAGIGSTAAVLAPLAASATSAAREGARMSVKGSGTRKRQAARTGRRGEPRRMRVVGITAAGALAGAIGAVLLRRQQQQKAWDDFDAERELGPEAVRGEGRQERVGAGVGGSGVLSSVQDGTASGAAGGRGAGGPSARGDQPGGAQPGSSQTGGQAGGAGTAATGSRTSAGTPGGPGATSGGYAGPDPYGTGKEYGGASAAGTGQAGASTGGAPKSPGGTAGGGERYDAMEPSRQASTSPRRGGRKGGAR